MRPAVGYDMTVIDGPRSKYSVNGIMGTWALRFESVFNSKMSYLSLNSNKVKYEKC
jgi:hypothetical protein